MSLREKVMSWLSFWSAPKRDLPPVAPHLVEEEMEIEHRIRQAAQESDEISRAIADASEKHVRRADDVKVVMNSVMKRTGTVVHTAEEALDILNRAGRR